MIQIWFIYRLIVVNLGVQTSEPVLQDVGSFNLQRASQGMYLTQERAMS